MRYCYIDYFTRGIVDLIQNDEKNVVISRVNTPAPCRGKGVARKLMKEVLADADAEGVTLWLEINPYGPMDFTQLEAWYGRLGFRKHPRNPQDKQLCYSYRRLPTNKES